MLQTRHPLPVDAWTQFDPVNHQYTLTDQPMIKFTTVTQAVAALFPTFDAAAVSEKLAKASKGRYCGMSPQAIRKEWTLAAQLGTEMHKAIENHYNNDDSAADARRLPLDFFEVDAYLLITWHPVNLRKNLPCNKFTKMA